MSKVAFVDTETTGLDADHHEIWEVGLIVDEVEHHWFLPVNLAVADPFALDIGSYYERHPYEQGDEILADTDFSRPGPFIEEFVRLTAGRHLVGAVISFDEERLRKLARAHGRLPRWHYHLIDVEALAVGCVVHSGREITLPWKSTDLSRSLGVDPDQFDKHTALGDARWAKAMYEAVMGVGIEDGER